MQRPQPAAIRHALPGRTYNYDLGRDLGIGLFESGIDFGKRDLFAHGDILVVGILGGAVEASLDYTALDRGFNLGGGEAGAYATYLNGGWFVDTLFKGFFGKVDPDQVKGFPDTLDNTTFGILTDTGYRFGGMRYGPFIEPLATLAASWSQVEDFVLDGNVVNLGGDDDVRGRLGLRLGTSSNIWNGTTFEPFVVGSLWWTLSDAHHASLVSNGRRYDFYDRGRVGRGVGAG
jgi:outer membrane autotransporter protein